jgi:hypothetical protein
VSIRKYKPSDRDGIIEIFKLNVPDFFDINETADLEEFLNQYSDTYFVVEQAGNIVGAGGYHFPDTSTGRLSWDFFHPDFKE